MMAIITVEKKTGEIWAPIANKIEQFHAETLVKSNPKMYRIMGVKVEEIPAKAKKKPVVEVENKREDETKSKAEVKEFIKETIGTKQPKQVAEKKSDTKPRDRKTNQKRSTKNKK